MESNKILPGSLQDRYSWMNDEYNDINVERDQQALAMEEGLFNDKTLNLFNQSLDGVDLSQTARPKEKNRVTTYHLARLISAGAFNYAIPLPINCFGVIVNPVGGAAGSIIQVAFSNKGFQATANLEVWQQEAAGHQEVINTGFNAPMKLLTHNERGIYVSVSANLYANFVLCCGDVSEDFKLQWATSL